MIKKLVLAALSVSVIAVTGCSQESGGQQAAGGQGAPSGVPVNVVTVEQQNVSTTLELPGRVSAFRQSHVRPQVTGVITQRLFEQGTVVEKGQQLYQIDDLQYKAALNSAGSPKTARAHTHSTVRKSGSPREREGLRPRPRDARACDQDPHGRGEAGPGAGHPVRGERSLAPKR